MTTDSEDEPTSSKPSYTLQVFLIQLSIVSSCGIWWKIQPPYPGVCIAVLAFIAVIMTVRADKFLRWEKTVWVLMGGALLFGEVLVIHHDINERTKQQQTADAQNESKFEATMTKFGDVLIGVASAVNLGKQEKLENRSTEFVNPACVQSQTGTRHNRSASGHGCGSAKLSSV